MMVFTMKPIQPYTCCVGSMCNRDRKKYTKAESDEALKRIEERRRVVYDPEVPKKFSYDLDMDLDMDMEMQYKGLESRIRTSKQPSNMNVRNILRESRRSPRSVGEAPKDEAPKDESPKDESPKSNNSAPTIPSTVTTAFPYNLWQFDVQQIHEYLGVRTYIECAVFLLFCIVLCCLNKKKRKPLKSDNSAPCEDR